MFDFFKGSFRELRHVVWPSRIETKKYFIIVLTVLVLFWLYLFIASTLFSELIFNLNNIFNNNTSSNFPINENSIIYNTWDLDNTITIDNNTWSINNITWSIDSTWSIVE